MYTYMGKYIYKHNDTIVKQLHRLMNKSGDSANNILRDFPANTKTHIL